MKEILLLIKKDSNRQLFEEYLEDEFSTTTAKSKSILYNKYDLVILDGYYLEKYKDVLKKRKEEEEPLFLPYLLIVPKDKIDRLSPKAFDFIDEIITSPVRKSELYCRIDSLLKNRERSITLKRERDELDMIRFLDQVMRHDFINGLSVIRGWTTLLSENLDDDEYIDYVTGIENKARKMDNLLNKIRPIIKTYDKSESDMKNVNVSQTLEDQIKHIKVAHDMDDIKQDIQQDIEIRADDMLSEIFKNVMENSIAHSDKDKVNIEVSLKNHDDKIMVNFKDNGPGIPDEVKKDIFKKGEKGDRSEGTGFGLYLVSRLVEKYGGNVNIEDNEPEGSVFILEFPKSEEDDYSEDLEGLSFKID